MKKAPLLVIVLVTCVLHALGQESVILRNEVFDAAIPENVVFYGIDFSNNKWVESKTKKRKSEVFFGEPDRKHFFDEWARLYHSEIPPSKYLRKWLRVGEDFTYDFMSVQDLKDVPLDEWIVESYQETSLSEIRQSLKNYKLKQNNGVGFVIQASIYNANQYYSVCRFIFFDIETRELLQFAEIKTKSEKLGHGGNRSPSFDIIIPTVLIRSTKAYIDKVYRKYLKAQKGR